MKNYYTHQEAADILGFAKSVLYKYEQKNLVRRIEKKYGHNSKVLFHKEDIDRLKEEKEQFSHGGKSVSEVAGALNVYDVKVKEAINALNLEIASVPTSVWATTYRFAIPASSRLFKEAWYKVYNSLHTINIFSDKENLV